jgi:hypothetical protein
VEKNSASRVSRILQCLSSGSAKESVKGVIEDGAGDSTEGQQVLVALGDHHEILEQISSRIANLLDIAQTNQNSSLSPGESGRFKAIFKILKDTIEPVKLEPVKPEADTLKASKIGKVAELEKVQEAETRKSVPGKKLLAGLGLAAVFALLTQLGPIGEYISKTIPKLVKVFKTIKINFSALSALFNDIKALPDKVFKTIKITFSALFNDIKALPGKVFETSKITFSALFNNIKALPGKVFETSKITFTSLFNNIKALPGKVFETIKITFTSLFNNIKALPGKALNSIASFFSGNKIASSFISGLTGSIKAGGGVLSGVRAVGGTMIKILKGALKGIGAPLLKTLKFVPYIGGLIGLGFAYSRFKSGDYIPATFELISAVLDFIPGAGWAASAMIDGGLLLYDIYNAKQEKKEGLGKPTQGFLKYISSIIGDSILPKLEYLPVVGGIIQFGRAVKLFAGGDSRGGLEMVGSSLFALVGGKGLADMISPGIDFVLSLFDTGTVDQPAEVTNNTGSKWADVVKSLWSDVGNIVYQKFNKIKDWVWSQATKFLSYLNVDNLIDSIKEESLDRVAGVLDRNNMREATSNLERAQQKLREQQASAAPQASMVDNLQVDSQLKEINQLQLNTLNTISNNILTLIKISKSNIAINTDSTVGATSKTSPTIKQQRFTPPKINSLDIRDEFLDSYSLTPST